MKAEGRKNRRRSAAFDALICLGAAALIAVIFATGLLNTQKVWPDVSFDHAKENASYSLTEGDGYGVKATSTSLNLDAGTYRLCWQIDGVISPPVTQPSRMAFAPSPSICQQSL